MSWTLDKQKKQIFSPAGLLFGTFYSGKEGINDEKIADGPLPSGEWEMWTVVFNHPKCGPDCIRIRPAVPAFGDEITKWCRNPLSFLIHGDNLTHTANEGCIVTTNADRRSMWDSLDRMIIVK
jgi:hypothetical protein